MSQKNIKLKIGDRVYPLTVSESEEKSVMDSAEKIAEKVKKLKLQYKINDSQDLLAMSCLEFVTQLQTAPEKPKEEAVDNIQRLDGIISQLNSALS